MLAYHYTSTVHLPHILRDGFLRPSESNVSLEHLGAGPDVVWLTSDADLPVGSSGLQSHITGLDKSEVRFTVDLPSRHLHRWSTWAPTVGCSPETMRILRVAAARMGGGTSGSSSWRIYLGPIPRERWLAVDLRTPQGWRSLEGLSISDHKLSRIG